MNNRNDSRPLVSALLAAGLLLALSGTTAAFGADSASVSQAQFTVSDFQTPFQISYGSWQNRVPVVGGRAVIKELATQGGVGTLVQLDLSPYARSTPVLRVKTTPANTARLIQFQITDANGLSANWQYVLPEPSSEFVALKPRGAAEVARPNALSRNGAPAEGKLDLAHIIQYQLQGDWGQGVIDVEVGSITLVAPDKGVLAERKVAEEIDAEAARAIARALTEQEQKQAREREQRIHSYIQRNANSPEVTHVSLVAPDILALSVASQRVVRGAPLTKYEPQPGDEKKIHKWPDGVVRYADVYRNGRFIGWVQGKNLDWFSTNAKLVGDPLLEFLADDPTNYTVHSDDDPDFAKDTKPASVFRKTKPFGAAGQYGDEHASRHQVYLKLPAKIKDGKTYTITVAKLNVKNGDLTLKADLKKVRSEAVHVNQIGYRPDDPGKRAFLSVWLGTGGAYSYPQDLRYSLVEDATGKTVLIGQVERVMAADGTEQLCTLPPKNYSSTAVYRMDFSRFDTPGWYRVYVESIGCSYPFQIGRSVWERAFLIQMKGLYNQRSGVELGPPYTDFRKPRDFHPDDGAVVTRSTHDVIADGPWDYDSMARKDTGEVVNNAWGGYHDAGDWNPRRVTHMGVTMAQLELCELFPSYFDSLKLNIPPTEGVPDIITEALFEIDCFRRLQLPDGAVPYGIETQGDCGGGEVSWLSSQHCYVLAPTMRDSWFYAAVAGRAAKVLKSIKPELSQIYLDSAVRAFDWAETEYARKRAANEPMERPKYWDAFDARNLSSLVLYDILGDKKHHAIFLENTCLKTPGSPVAAWEWNEQAGNVFLYARMDPSKTDPRFRALAREAVISLADQSMRYAEGNAFDIAQAEKPRPMFAGFFSTSGGTELVRAHYLTGKREYLAAAVRSCQFQSGCNPNNLVYTTGLGSNPVQAPLHVDSAASGQQAPVGITPWGNTDYFTYRDSFWDINLKYVNTPLLMWPDVYKWPLTEAYFDCVMLVSANEFVVETWSNNVLVWGYLSARPELPR